MARRMRVISTSERGWLAAIAKAYREEAFTGVFDDAGFGFDPNTDTLFDLARRAKLTPREIVAACLAAGMSAFGAAVVVIALLDPEPTTKSVAGVVAGGVMTVGGGWAAIYVLTNKKPPNVRAGPEGIAFWWPNAT